MRTIIGYMGFMLPYMLFALPLYAVGRFIYITAKQQRVKVLREIAMLVFFVFLFGLASQTVIPRIELGVNGIAIVPGGMHETNLIPFRVFANTYREVQCGNTESLLINFLGNILMFVPIGFFVPLLWDIAAWKVLLIGCGSSLFIETCQLFLPRQTDVDDVWLNTLGVFLGVVIFWICRRFAGKFVEKFRA